MKLREYMTESLKTVAIWISPKGEITAGLNNHISMIIKNPETFGMDFDYIKKIHDSFKEKIGQEGKARENILRSVVMKKFIRIRKYDKFYTINALMKNFLDKEHLTEWAKLMLSKGINGFKEPDKDFPVVMTDMGKYRKETTIGKIADGVLYETNENYIGNRLIIKKSITEFLKY